MWKSVPLAVTFCQLLMLMRGDSADAFAKWPRDTYGEYKFQLFNSKFSPDWFMKNLNHLI